MVKRLMITYAWFNKALLQRPLELSQSLAGGMVAGRPTARSGHSLEERQWSSGTIDRIRAILHCSTF